MVEVAKLYDGIQREYQANDGIELLEQLSISDGLEVLDLGCGTGYLASILSKKVGLQGSVKGIDPDQARIGVAKSNYSQLNNVEFLVGSSECYPPGPYDLIFSNHVLHWIEDKDSTFKIIYSNLKDDGVFAFVCPTETDTVLLDLYKPEIKDLFYLVNNDTYENLAKRYNFRVQHISEKIIRYNFSGITHFLEYAGSSGYITSICRDAPADATINEGVANRLDMVFRQRGGIYVDWKRATVILNKI